MPYKIVQTIEKGRAVLTTVPHEWENDGILYWPKKTEINKLRRIEDSRPEANWERLNCILKRSKIPSFTKAESEIDKMSNFSDTDTDNNYQNTRNYIKNPEKSHKISMQRKYNEMARDLMESQTQPMKENVITQDTAFRYSQVLKEPFNLQSVEINSDIPTSIPLHTVTENHENLTDTMENYNIISEEMLTGMGNSNLMTNMTVVGNDTEPVQLPAQHTGVALSNLISADEALTLILQKIGGVQEDLSNLASDVKTINNNQQIMFHNQRNILSKVTELHSQLEEIIRQSYMSKTPDSKSVDFKPISNQDELQELESSLRDPDFKSRMMTKMEIVCSKGKNRGTTNAYALIDVLFERKFLVECSWGGGSKSDQSKIGLRNYKYVFDLFLSVLHQSDHDFKKPDCEKFFKTIIKNARQRLASKQTRLSTTRLRLKVNKNNTKSHNAALVSGQPNQSRGNDEGQLSQELILAAETISENVTAPSNQSVDQ